MQKNVISLSSCDFLLGNQLEALNPMPATLVLIGFATENLLLQPAAHSESSHDFFYLQ